MISILWMRVDLVEQKLQPFFPPLEPLQSLNLRAALFRCVNGLKKNGILGRSINIRKSMFDDCKGEIVHHLLSAFSTIVLRKAMKSAEVSKSSIVGRLCTDARARPRDFSSMLPLSIAHRASLTILLREKRNLDARYRYFGHALAAKDSDLVSKFDKVVETQNFLDENPPSESTVERVSRVLNQHWQGDQRQVEVIAQGEEHSLRDALLDQSFEAVWQNVSIGRFDGDISTNRYGLLQDLENRVTMQRARLQQWKDYKNDLHQRKPSRREKPATKSPIKQAFDSPYSHKYEQRKGKDLVFSPRKSPRKSIRPAENRSSLSTSEDLKHSDIHGELYHTKPTSTANINEDVDSSPLAAKSKEIFKFPNRDLHSSSGIGRQENEPDLAKESASAYSTEMQAISLPREPNDTNDCSLSIRSLQNHIHGINLQAQQSDIVHDRQSAQTQTRGRDGINYSEKPTKNGTLSEPLILSTTHAEATSLMPKLSLLERTRQSMAFTSSAKHLPGESPPLNPQSPTLSIPALRELDTRATLAERTRQSISLVPAKPKLPRDSIHTRRTSKVYPTNQFETPRRQQMDQKMTPPEELMSPGAGYDSVFKSRPKVAFSPTNSHVSEAMDTGTSDMNKLQINTQLEDLKLV